MQLGLAQGRCLGILAPGAQGINLGKTMVPLTCGTSQMMKAICEYVLLQPKVLYKNKT